MIDLKDDLISKLSRVVQLTGFSDPVYAEAIVNVHQYDILLGKITDVRLCIISYNTLTYYHLPLASTRLDSTLLNSSPLAALRFAWAFRCPHR